MATYHRAVFSNGEPGILARDGLEYRLFGDGRVYPVETFMWVDPEPIDLQPAQYTDTKLVELGDWVCVGGDEFNVLAVEPAQNKYPFGRLRGGNVWYACEYAALLNRKGE